MRINYNAEKKLIFDLNYNLHDYVPPELISEDIHTAELKYIIRILGTDPNIKYLGKMTLVWCIHFKFELGMRKFSVVFDEDYAIVSFATDSAKDREKVAEYIASLIEKNKLLD